VVTRDKAIDALMTLVAQKLHELAAFAMSGRRR
jgi:hypothetical protein